MQVSSSNAHQPPLSVKARLQSAERSTKVLPSHSSEESSFSVTVILQLAVLPDRVAVMFASPLATAVTTPLATVAAALLSVFHTSPACEKSAGVRVSVRVTVYPASRLLEAGLIEMLSSFFSSVAGCSSELSFGSLETSGFSHEKAITARAVRAKSFRNFIVYKNASIMVRKGTKLIPRLRALMREG